MSENDNLTQIVFWVLEITFIGSFILVLLIVSLTQKNPDYVKIVKTECYDKYNSVIENQICIKEIKCNYGFIGWLTNPKECKNDS